MNFSEKIDIENNIVKYAIKAKYNEELTDEEIMEVETLHDYVKKIKFSEIDFTAITLAVKNRQCLWCSR